MLSESDSIVASLIIPALNEEKLIADTLAQFTPDLRKKFNIEIIVSDGGSTDRTLQIAEGSADSILQPVKGEKQNISKGRNSGARHASGKYLFFLNADTRIADVNSFFENTLALLEDPTIAALTMKFKVFPQEKKLSDSIFHSVYNNYVYVLNKLGMGMGRGECQIVKKELFEKIRGYNETLAAGEDFDLYRRIKKFGKIKYIRKLIVYESPRRYRKYGYRKVLWDWTKNSISVVLKNRSVSDTWDPVR